MTSTLYDLVRRGAAVSDDAWRMSILSDDPLFDRFTGEQREWITTAAATCGERRAAATLADFPGTRPVDVAASLGRPAKAVSFAYNKRMKLLYMGQYRNDSIYVSQEALTQIGSAVREHRLSGLLGTVDAEDVIVGHELFHFFEETDPELGLDQVRVRIKVWNLFPQNVRPAVADEIAASSFSQRLAGLGVNPRVLEVIHMFGTRPDVAASMVAKAERFMGRRARG